MLTGLIVTYLTLAMLIVLVILVLLAFTGLLAYQGVQAALTLWERASKIKADHERRLIDLDRM